MGFSGSSNGKESACNVGDLGSIPVSGRPPGEGYGYPLQYSCLENPMDRGAPRATVHGVTESDTTEQLTLSLSCVYAKGTRKEAYNFIIFICLFPPAPGIRAISSFSFRVPILMRRFH